MFIPSIVQNPNSPNGHLWSEKQNSSTECRILFVRDTLWHLLPCGPSKSTGCWQYNLRLQKKWERQNMKSYTKKTLSILNYRTLLFSYSSSLRGRISFPDLTQVTEHQHPAWTVAMSSKYWESFHGPDFQCYKSGKPRWFLEQIFMV